MDGEHYQVPKKAVKLLGNDDQYYLDLAVMQFRSSHNYAVAKIAFSSGLKATDDVYTAGFPLEQPGFSFNEGTAIAVVNKRLIGDSGGYTIIYNAFTLPGMSGCGVFDGNGQLVAIHGVGDRFKENTELNSKARVNNKIGYNRGIPIRWLVNNLATMNIDLGGISIAFQDDNRSASSIRSARSQIPENADEHFIAGFNKFVDPGNKVVAGKKQAIQEFSKAIQLNPQYTFAYFTRAYVYRQLQDFQSSLNDYSQAIKLNPKFTEAYNNRAVLKYANLNDVPGALADYNQAIILNSKYANAYINRGTLKNDKLNDVPGALADYNQAITLNPKSAESYYNRALLKEKKLNNSQGALADYNQAIALNPKNAEFYYNRALLKDEKLNDAPGALADYSQAITLNPNDSQAYNNRGVLKGGTLNDVPGALADFNQAIALNPKDSRAYFNRGTLKYVRLNGGAGALADYNQAITLNLKYADAYYNRALLKKNRLSDQAGAVQDFRQAARLYREQGQTQYLQDAINQLQRLGTND